MVGLSDSPVRQLRHQSLEAPGWFSLWTKWTLNLKVRLNPTLGLEFTLKNNPKNKKSFLKII